MKILVFGNLLLKKDNLPLKLISDLEKEFPQIEFNEFDTVEQLQDQGKDLIIIDSVKDIKKVVLITDIDQLETEKIFTMHDFDLAYNLKLMKKVGMIESVKIYGVPIEMDKEKALTQLITLIRSSLKPL